MSVDSVQIGILTFHYAHNYGAVLQAYALKKMLELKGVDVRVIPYINKNIAGNYPRHLKVEFCFSDFVHPVKLKNKILSFVQIPYRQKAWEKKHDRFQFFINKYISDTAEEVCFDELKNIHCNALIVGSDQVWEETLLNGLDAAYLLDFDFGGYRFSYAASKAGYCMREGDFGYLTRCLNRFDKISVREHTLASYLQKGVDQEIVQVIDPTLLLDMSTYQDIIATEQLEPERYVFAYFVREDNQMLNYAQKIAEIRGEKLIELHYYLRKILKHHNQIADLGPSEFLWYILNADVVITNSFHGVAFSVIFHKNFYAVYEKNNRIDDLLERLDLKHRHKQGQVEIEADIDYKLVEYRLEEIRKPSLAYLDTIIEMSGKKW